MGFKTGGVTGCQAGRLWPLLKYLLPAALIYLLLRKARQMATYSLAQLKADVDKIYAGLDLEIGDDDVITLKNILRLPEGDRGTVTELLNKINEASEDNDLNAIAKHTFEVLEIAAGTRGADLIAVLGDDVALAMDILGKWSEQTQVGEAEPSQS